MPLDLSYRQPSAEAVKKISDFARKTGDYASLSAVDIRVLAVTYDLEVEMVGTSHLRSEPVIKKTTNFYHPKVDKEKINKSDAKLPGFFMEDEDEIEVVHSLKKSESFDQFNYWREPLLDLRELALDGNDVEKTIKRSETGPNWAGIRSGEVSEKELNSLNSYLLKRSFFCEHDVSRVDFAVQEFLKDMIINEEKQSNLVRWSVNISSYEILDHHEVDMFKVLEHVEKNEDIVFEKVTITEEIEESSEDYQDNLSDDDFGYDSDKENDISGDDDDGWITPGNVKTKKAVYNGTEEGKAPQKASSSSCSLVFDISLRASPPPASAADFFLSAPAPAFCASSISWRLASASSRRFFFSSASLAFFSFSSFLSFSSSSFFCWLSFFSCSALISFLFACFSFSFFSSSSSEALVFLHSAMYSFSWLLRASFCFASSAASAIVIYCDISSDDTAPDVLNRGNITINHNVFLQLAVKSQLKEY